MSGKSSPLANFKAAKNREAPVSGAMPAEAPQPAVKGKPAANDEAPMVPVGFRMTEAERWELRRYAASLSMSVQGVLTEALDLHRAKYGKR